MSKNMRYQQGLALLQRPVLPLVNMVHFLFLTGAGDSLAEVIHELPADIETAYTVYAEPAVELAPYMDLLQPLAALREGARPKEQVVDEQGQEVDAMTATIALINQQIVTRELEQINSALCAPCDCTLCCVGPDEEMMQQYFEIPLQADEEGRFSLNRIDTASSRVRKAADATPLQVKGAAFYQSEQPLLIHWQSGWSLILPKKARCPGLEESGWCRIYEHRPQVCRRPQIFPYILESTEEGVMRVRQSILAVVDCPYVQDLKDEIAAYAAACELEMIFRRNKA